MTLQEIADGIKNGLVPRKSPWRVSMLLIAAIAIAITIGLAIAGIGFAVPVTVALSAIVLVELFGLIELVQKHLSDWKWTSYFICIGLEVVGTGVLGPLIVGGLDSALAI